MKVILAGSRTITDYEELCSAILLANFEITEVVSGKAKGVDTLGERFAKEFGLPVKEFPANWDKYGRSAGHIRNEEMAKYAEACICLWDGKSRGTKSMIHLSEKYNLKLYVHLI